MSSLKEIKERIGSVSSTRKITSAMKMVAAAKLRRAQNAIGALLPYSETLQGMVTSLLSGENIPRVPLAEERAVNKVTFVAFSSNGTLCGSFNGSVWKLLEQRIKAYDSLPPENIEILAIGKQIAAEARFAGLNNIEEMDDIAEKPVYEIVAHLAQHLSDNFLIGKTDRVELLYHRFLSAGRQKLVSETLLPLCVNHTKEAQSTEYILEPSRNRLLETLIPREIRLRLYAVALSSAASEHAARMMAMQSATENADELIDSLSIEYNKSRQQAITSELLDIMGGQNNG